MRRMKVQNLRSLREEMKAVARGERPAPADARTPSFDSVAAVVRLLTPENRRLLTVIRDRKPQSVADLVQWTGRAQPNLTRTLAKFEAAGFITIITITTLGRRKAPSATVKRIVVEIDPYSDRDRMRIAEPALPVAANRLEQENGVRVRGHGPVAQDLELRLAPDELLRHDVPRLGVERRGPGNGIDVGAARARRARSIR